MEKRFYSFIIVLLIMSSCAFANNRNAIGIRLSNDFGISYKYQYKKNTILEGILSMPQNAIIISGIYERYNKIEGLKGLDWFYGGGIYIGINTSNTGIKGAIGLNYQFVDIPLEISIDWMPGLQIINTVQGRADSGGLSIRYRF